MKKLLVVLAAAFSLAVAAPVHATDPAVTVAVTGDPSTYDVFAWLDDNAMPIPWSFTWSGTPPVDSDGVTHHATVAMFTTDGVDYIVTHNDPETGLYDMVVPTSLYGGNAGAASAATAGTFEDMAPGQLAWGFDGGELTPALFTSGVSYGSGGGTGVSFDLVGDAFDSSTGTLAAYVGTGVGVIVAVLLLALGVGLLVRYLRKGVRAA